MISNLAGGYIWYRLEFAHPDGEHFTEVDLDDDYPPATYKKIKVRVEDEAEPPKKARRVSWWW